MQTWRTLIREDDADVLHLSAAHALSLCRSAIVQKSAHLDGFLMKYYGNLDSDWIE
ncbi:hypothetical protein GRAQ_04901 [Rahnella aquatilis CIP 78.65 = ATCC 33071]|nr:hypothetical protein GRAQ_04901 [Rahnella aquatilis CIP 78.65 = ATCC 33071]